MHGSIKGLNAYQIKMLAVILMTIDHLGAYGSAIPVFGFLYPHLRLIGRLAAPLFFFILTESIGHTRSKPKFLLRLYLAAVCVGLFSAVTNYLFSGLFGQRMDSNILFDYFYVALYCMLLELLMNGINDRSSMKCIWALIGLALSVLPHYLWDALMRIDGIWLLDQRMIYLCVDLIDSFVRSPLYVDYTILFTAMGVAMYFARSKERKAIVLLVFSAICCLGINIPVQQAALIFPVLGYPQWCMVFAAPIMLLYNGEKGNGNKHFFYLYYPLHRFAIMAAAWGWILFAA